MQKPKIIIALIAACKAIGKQNTIELLEGLAKKDKTQMVKYWIITTTCSELGVGLQSLNKKVLKNNENIINANIIIAHLLNKHNSYSNSKIAEILGKKDPSSISRYLGYVNNLDSKFKKEAEILDKIKTIEKTIQEYKEKIKF